MRNAISGRQYSVGQPLGEGGFGAVYQVVHVNGGAPLPTNCVLKVAGEPRAWHREAYFGDLLKNESGVVQVYESFAWVPRGAVSNPLYCLISELVEGGDLLHYLQRHRSRGRRPARREIIRPLRSDSPPFH